MATQSRQVGEHDQDAEAAADLEPHQIDDFLVKLGALTNLAGQRDHAVVATFFSSASTNTAASLPV